MIAGMWVVRSGIKQAHQEHTSYIKITLLGLSRIPSCFSSGMNLPASRYFFFGRLSRKDALMNTREEIVELLLRRGWCQANV